MNLENLDETLAEIRQAAKEYYARKSGTWKPKRDLDAELLEDEARFRRESMDIFGGSLHSTLRMMSYASKISRVDSSEQLDKLRDDFAKVDFSYIEERIRKIPAKELKDYQHKFLYGEWVEPPKIGAGKNPMAEHTIRSVKKSHAKRRFSRKSK